MSELPSVFRRLDDLVERQGLGTLSDEQRADVEQIVASDLVARRYYLERTFLIAQLAWQLDNRNRTAAPGTNPAICAIGTTTDADAPTALQTPKPRSPILGFLAPVINVAASWFTSPKILALVVLGSLTTYFAGLMISIAISRALLNDRSTEPRTESPAAAPARIVAASGCRWQDRSPKANPITELPAGTSRLTEGVVELEFDGGARVTIEGPAEFAPRSGQRMELMRGRLVAYVPKQARGFTINTPTAEVIDLGTEFGVEVDVRGSTDLHVIRGRVEVKPAVKPNEPARRRGQQVSAGEAVRVSVDRATSASIPLDTARFDVVRSSPAAAPPIKQRPARPKVDGEAIWLSNLFDDRPGIPLAEAMGTDTFKATPKLDETLGIDRVIYGGSALLEAAPGVWLDLANLGWIGAGAQHHIANDSWSHDEKYNRNGRAAGGIRLDGKPMSLEEPKMEEGIGMHAEALLTFDLDQIRSAGKLEEQEFEFVCDQAGINDTSVGQGSQGSVHLAVLVSRRGAPQTVWVDGAVARLDKLADHWFVSSPVGNPLRVDGEIVSFRVPIDSGAQFLTLIASATSDGIFWDHAVWLGARLEFKP